MQIVYKFRVHFEEHDDVVRFIDIESTSNFADFHRVIQESVGFDGSKAFSFFLSDDIWRENRNICQSDAAEGSSVKLPGQTFLHTFINDPHQRFIYHFDPDLDWTFHIELVKIQKAEFNKKYPLIARKEGEAPKQYKLKGKLPGATASNEYEKMAEMLMASRLMDELNKSADDSDDVDEPDDLEDLEADIPDLELPAAEKIPDIKPVTRKPATFDLKFDEEELKMDADDFDLFNEEEGEEDEEEQEDEFGSDDYGGYGRDDGDDY